MTELGVFGVTIRCHPELDPESFPRTNNLDAQRRNEEPVFPKDGFMVWDEGPRTALPSAQRVLGFKRRAVSNERSRAGPPNRTILGQALWDDW
ncbi:hypothetical protein Y697_09720 [Mesotoga sp. BH458_6_3_2_1]|nr:hypothetical protein Y697_09720 [Mesotoga sp. BH458_6_3_2_1]